MRSIVLGGFSIFLIAAASGAVAEQSGGSAGEADGTQLLVQFAPNVEPAAIQSIHKSLGAKVLHTVESGAGGTPRIDLVTVPYPSTLDRVAEAYRHHNEVLLVQKNFEYSIPTPPPESPEPDAGAPEAEVPAPPGDADRPPAGEGDGRAPVVDLPRPSGTQSSEP